MSNMYGKDKFHDRQKAVLQKSAQKIENDSGWSQDNFLRGYVWSVDCGLGSACYTLINVKRALRRNR